MRAEKRSMGFGLIRPFCLESYIETNRPECIHLQHSVQISIVVDDEMKLPQEFLADSFHGRENEGSETASLFDWVG